MKKFWPWIRHHAVWPLIPTTAALLVVSDITGRHWTLHVASYAIAVPTGFLVYQVGTHHTETNECPHCTMTSDAKRSTLRYRAWRFWGRWGLLLLSAFVAVTMTSALLIWGPAKDKHNLHFNWPWDLLTMSYFLLALSWSSAFRFVKRHSITHDYSGPAEWLSTHARGLLHRSLPLYLVSIVLRVAAGFLPQEGAWGAVFLFSLTFLIGAMYLTMRHSMGLCEECAMEFRDDAPNYAAIHRKRFRTYHTLMSPQVTVPLLLLFFGGMFLPGKWDMTTVVPFYGAIGAGAVLGQFHSKFQPWCPICHPGGGGGQDAEQVPDPSDDHGRPLPSLA